MKYILLGLCILFIASCSVKTVVVTPKIPLPEQPEILSCDHYIDIIEESVVWDAMGEEVSNEMTLSMFLDSSECQRDITEAWQDDSTILRRLIERHNQRDE